MHIQLMTDSGTDIPKEISDLYDIKVVPLYLHFSDGQYKSGVDLDTQSYHQKVKELGELPQSAAPSPNDFYEAYKEVDPSSPILMLSLSAGLSSTYENAVAGKDLLLEEEPNRKIEVINTKTTSCGPSLLLHEAITKIKDGYDFVTLVDYIQEKTNYTTSLFVLKTLDNLVQGGRLDKLRGKIAKTLNVKLLMRGSDEGTIEVSEKVRGEKKSIRRFIDQIGEYTKEFENKIITMTHCNDESRAKNVLSMIREKYPFKDAYLTDMGPLIANYGGDGAIVIAFFND